MKVEVAPSFFDSIKSMNSWKNKWYQIRCWFKYHSRKKFLNIIRIAFKGYPWQESFLYELERAKLQEMIEYHKKAQRFVGWENVVRDMQICVNLIGIILEEKDLFTYERINNGPLFSFTKIEETDNYEMNSNAKYICKIHVNTKNATRFIPLGENNPNIEFWKEHPHEIYLLKAKALYHKIRTYKDSEWWD